MPQCGYVLRLSSASPLRADVDHAMTAQSRFLQIAARSGLPKVMMGKGTVLAAGTRPAGINGYLGKPLKPDALDTITITRILIFENKTNQ